MRKTSYEWAIECYDGNFEIADSRYWGEGMLSAAIDDAKAQEAGGQWAAVDFALCRHVHDDLDEIEREYYYIEDGKFLPSSESGLPPKRFQKIAFEGVGR